jgi:hypothetical protein
MWLASLEASRYNPLLKPGENNKAKILWRVYYPLITRDTFADFDTHAEAVKFAGEMRNRNSPYLSIHAWRRVSIVEILDQEPEGV